MIQIITSQLSAIADTIVVQGSESSVLSVGEPVFMDVERGIEPGVLLCIVISVLFVSFALWMGFRIWKKNHDLARLLQNLEEAKIKNRNCSEIIFRLIDDREQLVRTLMEQERKIDPADKSLSLLDYVEKLQGITDDYSKVIKGLREDPKYFSQLEMAVNAGKNGVMNITRRLFGSKYSEEDYQLISGFFAGLSPATLSFMTGIRAGTIRVKKSRFRDRIEALAPSTETSVLLKELD